MTLEEKKTFIIETSQGIIEVLLKKLPDTPERWDEKRLRMWIALVFNERTGSLKITETLSEREWMQFHTEVLAKSLL